MDEEKAAPAARPYFVPDGVDFEVLPRSLQIAFQELVEPTYRELLLGAKTGLERSAASTLIFLFALEVLEQFAMGRQMDFAQAGDSTQQVDRDKQIHRYLKLVNSKQQAASFILRLKTIRAKRDPLLPASQFS